MFEDEAHADVLSDYFLYESVADGRSRIDRALEEDTWTPKERALLEAKATARFSLFEDVEIVPGIGAKLLDLITGETEHLVDVNLSRNPRPGFCVAGRIFRVDGLTMTTGATLGTSGADGRQIASVLASPEFSEAVAHGRAPSVSTLVLRLLLEGPDRAAREPARAPPTPKVGRNDPCPCGSGKKHKKCCGA